MTYFNLDSALLYPQVAKAGGEDLEGEIILKLIEPFAKELAEGEDERLAKHIEERIYQHLMRQSDIGVASEEALDGNVEESTDGKIYL